MLVEANTSSLTNLLSSVQYAAAQSGVSVVSMSWGASEFSSETSYDSYFTTPAGHTPVAFVASAGDGGAGALWPAASPNVLAVGGTTLNTTSNGTYVSESAWSSSGGGKSLYESEPAAQDSVQSSGQRETPDVAFDANPATGFAIYDSVPGAGQAGWIQVGGTSAGAPQWAALIATADQGLALKGQPAIANAPAAIYGLSASDFHDITTGSNGNAASAGYDLVTGRGTPIANALVSALVGPGVAQAAGATSGVTHSTFLAYRMLASSSSSVLTLGDSGLSAVGDDVASLAMTLASSGVPGGLGVNAAAANVGALSPGSLAGGGSSGSRNAAPLQPVSLFSSPTMDLPSDGIETRPSGVGQNLTGNMASSMLGAGGGQTLVGENLGGASGSLGRLSSGKAGPNSGVARSGSSRAAASPSSAGASSATSGCRWSTPVLARVTGSATRPAEFCQGAKKVRPPTWP